MEYADQITANYSLNRLKLASFVRQHEKGRTTRLYAKFFVSRSQQNRTGAVRLPFSCLAAHNLLN